MSNFPLGSLPALQPRLPTKPSSQPSQPPELARASQSSLQLPFPLRPPGPESTEGSILNSSQTYRGLGRPRTRTSHPWPPCGTGTPELALPRYPAVCGAHELEPKLAHSPTPGAGYGGLKRPNAHPVAVPWGHSAVSLSSDRMQISPTPLFPHASAQHS